MEKHIMPIRSSMATQTLYLPTATFPCNNKTAPSPILLIKLSTDSSLSLSKPRSKVFTHLKPRYSSENPRHDFHIHSHAHANDAFVIKVFLLFFFSFALLCLRLVSNILLPGFHQRWHSLVSLASDAEAKLRRENYPLGLLQAVVAYEDRRFFCHSGVDPFGIARAVVSFSALGGGSTITQQIYWGHGVHGIIPSPELRSPFRDSSRGKTFQARVLRRMVEVGFLNVETTLIVVKESLHLYCHGLYQGDGMLFPLSSSVEDQVSGKILAKGPKVG